MSDSPAAILFDKFGSPISTVSGVDDKVRLDITSRATLYSDSGVPLTLVSGEGGIPRVPVEVRLGGGEDEHTYKDGFVDVIDKNRLSVRDVGVITVLDSILKTLESIDARLAQIESE